MLWLAPLWCNAALLIFLTCAATVAARAMQLLHAPQSLLLEASAAYPAALVVRMLTTSSDCSPASMRPTTTPACGRPVGD
jgi:hypothetical protein